MNNFLSFGTWLRHRRKVIDLTQQQLAELVGCSLSTIRKFEQDTRRPSVSIAQLLAQHLAVHTEGQELFIQAARGHIAPETLPLPEYAGFPLKAEQAEHFSIPFQPGHVAPIIGREHEIHYLLDLIAAPPSRLITLTGPGGVGKTHLAQVIATMLANQEQRDVLWLDLAPLQDEKSVFVQLARLLDIPHTQRTELTSMVQRVLQQRNSIVFLDNCEHLPQLATVCTELLNLSNHLLIIATSRTVLHSYGEMVVRIAPFPVALVETYQTVEQYLTNPAICFFLELVQRKGFVLDQSFATLQQIGTICYQLDGLPLAIELAAARMSVLSPQLFVQQLSEQRRFLHYRVQGRPERQTSLYAMIKWSFDLLSIRARLLFLQLSIWIDHFDLSVVSWLVHSNRTQETDGTQIIEELLDANLVQRIDQGATEPRFMLLETLRAFAHEYLQEQKESSMYHSRHAEYYLHMVTETVTHFYTEHEVQAFEQIEQHYNNITQALRWWHEQQQWNQAANISIQLGHYWDSRGLYTEGTRWFEPLCAHFVEACETQAAIYRWLGTYLFFLNDHVMGEQYLKQSLAFYTQAQMVEHMGPVLNNLGNIVIDKDAEQARAYYAQAIEIYTGLNSERTLIAPLGNLAMLNLVDTLEQRHHSTAADFDQQIKAVLQHYDRVLGLCIKFSNEHHAAVTWCNIANCYIAIEDYTRAQAALTESLIVNARARSETLYGHVYSFQAHLALIDDEPEEALLKATHSLQVYHSHDYYVSIGTLLMTWADIYLQLQHTEYAQQIHALGQAYLDPLNRACRAVYYDQLAMRVEQSAGTQVPDEDTTLDVVVQHILAEHAAQLTQALDTGLSFF